MNIKRKVMNGEAAATVLTDERIDELCKPWVGLGGVENQYAFARAIEREVLAHAGVTAEPAGLTDAEITEATSKIYLSDFGGRGTQAYDIAVARAILDAQAKKSAAPTIPAQVPAAEVRAQALNEAAELCGSIYQNHRDQYKGRGKYAPPADNPRRADSHCDGCADGAAECEEAIRSLAQQSTADKASEVRAAEWISVEDERKPDLGENVLLYVRTQTRGWLGDIPCDSEGAQIELGEYRRGESDEMSYFDCYASPISENDWITHWMPLPTPPSTADSANTGALGEGAEA